MKSFTLFLLFFGFLMVVPASVLAAPDYKGMSITSWSSNGYATSDFEKSILNMQEIGTDTAAINLFRVSTDTRISNGNYGASLSSVQQAIQFAHSQDMQVLLKPNVDPLIGGWRGEWKPADVNHWFGEVYTPFILEVAAIAAEENVAIFSIGTEFNQLERYGNHWRDLASSIRDIYPGQLTYAANHSPAKGAGGYKSLSWWDAMDIVGIDAYFPLTNRDNPTYTELAKSWRDNSRDIANWRQRYEIDQPIIFTEVGYPSRENGARYPWGQDSNNPVSMDVQADAYLALLTTMNQQDWFAGAFWWMWEVDPRVGGINDNSFTPQRKPAQDILQEHYRLLPIGDANLDYQFDQMDLIQVLLSDKYLTGLTATWEEGDWNGLGATVAQPNVGDGVFNQLDIISALKSSQGRPFNVNLQASLISTVHDIPEPPGFLLAAIGLVVLVYIYTSRH